MRNMMKIISISVASIAVLMSILNIIDMPIEIRFKRPEYNYLFVMTLCVVLPFSIFMMSLTLRKRSNMFLAMVVSVVLALPSYLVYFFASSNYESVRSKGVDLSFLKINELVINGAEYRLYRTNGGATTPFGLVLRKETKLVLGINVVEVVFSKYKASESILVAIDDNIIELRIEPYSKGGNVEVVTLGI